MLPPNQTQQLQLMSYKMLHSHEEQPSAPKSHIILFACIAYSYKRSRAGQPTDNNLPNSPSMATYRTSSTVPADIITYRKDGKLVFVQPASSYMVSFPMVGASDLNYMAL